MATSQIGDQRNAVLDGQFADQSRVRRFVVIFVAHQNVDDEIEPVGLQEGEDVGRVAVGDLVNDGVSNAVLVEKLMGTRGREDVHVERQETADRGQHLPLVFRPARADENVLAAFGPSSFRLNASSSSDVARAMACTSEGCALPAVSRRRWTLPDSPDGGQPASRPNGWPAVTVVARALCFDARFCRSGPNSFVDEYCRAAPKRPRRDVGSKAPSFKSARQSASSALHAGNGALVTMPLLAPCLCWRNQDRFKTAANGPGPRHIDKLAPKLADSKPILSFCSTTQGP